MAALTASALVTDENLHAETTVDRPNGQGVLGHWYGSQTLPRAYQHYKERKTVPDEECGLDIFVALAVYGSKQRDNKRWTLWA